ncbi:MAG: LLM class flavin-dependent oxidoreductase [Chloroflexia bacterium]|nr:LLM class flavin-dependent oxidoreductase [Chloroflexia bacterium]MDQ3413090.1 LLM class flavin-dependent oxidoreductase [Chloroflexota bacterium]
MGEALQFGIQTTATRPWPEMVELWQRAEALGFDSCWLPDHLIPPFNRSGPIFEAWTLLAGLATVTDRVRIGILVSCNTFRHPPLLAKEAVTVDHLSGGRLEFGLGAGWFAPEHEMFGLELPAAKELVDRFREAVELCHLLFTQEITSYDGRYYQLREAPFRPPALQRPRPPFTLGAHGPKMLRIVAEYAHRWNSTGTVAEMTARNRVLDEQCAAIGRDPATILRSHLYVPGILTDERPWDSTEAFLDFVGRFREAGVTEFIVQPPAADPLAAIERIGAEALPAARHVGAG